MKVKDLIEKLQTLPGDMIVVRPGYEGGVRELAEVKVEKVALDVNSEWYYGKHELIEEMQGREEEIEKTEDMLSIY